MREKRRSSMCMHEKSRGSMCVHVLRAYGASSPRPARHCHAFCSPTWGTQCTTPIGAWPGVAPYCLTWRACLHKLLATLLQCSALFTAYSLQPSS